jgi:adenosylcobyric acid synthase
MLGEEIVDEVESKRGRVAGLGLLPVATTFAAEKLTRPRSGRALGAEVSGYEIRQGRPAVRRGAAPASGAPGKRAAVSQPSSFVALDDGFGIEEEGVSAEDGRLVGTNLHGLLDSDELRALFLEAVARRRQKSFVAGESSFAAARFEQIDRLADLVEEHVDMTAVFRLVASAGSPR